MTKKKFTKFESAFTYEHIETTLSGLTAMSAYSFTKRGNPTEFNNLLNFLQTGYLNRQLDNIESIDLVYSGSTASPFLLTLAVGRNDTFNGQEKFDIDVINIAPDTGATASYFCQQWHHFKDENGERVSYDINPFVITDEEKKKDITYAVFLTGSTSYYNLDDYQKQRPDFYSLHNKSFGDLEQ
jgi:hypothetical protein